METKEFSTKSRVRGDFQARFCEKGRVKFPPTYSTIPIATISQGMGHNSYKTTQIYLQSLDVATINEANKRIIKTISKEL